MKNCEICGKELVNVDYRTKFCQPEEGKKYSDCQKESKKLINKRYKKNPMAKDMFKLNIRGKKYNVKCLKCDKIFKGNKGNRICNYCKEVYNRLQTREPRTYKIASRRVYSHNENKENSYGGNRISGGQYVSCDAY